MSRVSSCKAARLSLKPHGVKGADILALVVCLIHYFSCTLLPAASSHYGGSEAVVQVDNQRKDAEREARCPAGKTALILWRGI